VLAELRGVHPTLELQISVDTMEGVVSRIVANEIDIGVVTLPAKEHPSVEMTPLRQDPMQAFFPGEERGLPREATPQYLAARSLLLNQRHSQTYKVIAEWFQNAGVELRPVMELGNTEAIKTLVAAGVGVGILPVERKPGLLPYGRVQVRPLKPRLVRHLGLVRRRDKALERPLEIVHAALLALSNRMS
jgi:DNA-binding transcriptional LysR family regulator